MKKHSNALHGIAFLLLLLGGLHFLILGLTQWPLLTILGDGFANIVYILIGLSALYELVSHKKTCKECDRSKEETSKEKVQEKPEKPEEPEEKMQDEPMEEDHDKAPVVEHHDDMPMK